MRVSSVCVLVFVGCGSTSAPPAGVGGMGAGSAASTGMGGAGGDGAAHLVDPSCGPLADCEASSLDAATAKGRCADAFGASFARPMVCALVDGGDVDGCRNLSAFSVGVGATCDHVEQPIWCCLTPGDAAP